MQDLYNFETEGNTEHGVCPDCGKIIRLIWGYVFKKGKPFATYYSRFNEGHLDRGLHMLIVEGSWGDDSSENDRFCFSVECRMGPDRPTYMLVDADKSYEELGKALTREQALAHPFKDELFPMLDQLTQNDAGIKKFLTGAK